MNPRIATFERTTAETTLACTVNLDGIGQAQVRTGIGFLDHLLATLSRHSRIDVQLACRGDLHVDDHHTSEDSAIALGSAIDRALGDRRGILRFGWALAPLDEALARAVVDLSGRPFPRVRLKLRRERLGDLATENIAHLLGSLAIAARATLHVDVLRGRNDHHRAEAAVKALALALRQAVDRDGSAEIPSAKGVL